MKKFLLASAALVLSVACTKKSPEKAATDAATTAPVESAAPAPSDVAPATEEVSGHTDATHSVPSETTPAGEGQLPTDTTTAPGTESPAPQGATTPTTTP